MTNRKWQMSLRKVFLIFAAYGAVLRILPPGEAVVIGTVVAILIAVARQGNGYAVAEYGFTTLLGATVGIAAGTPFAMSLIDELASTDYKSYRSEDHFIMVTIGAIMGALFSYGVRRASTFVPDSEDLESCSPE